MEDGEIIEDEIDLDFADYVPLQRPAELIDPGPRPPAITEVDSEPEEEEEESSSDDSDADDGGRHRQSKKPRLKVVKPRPAPVPVNRGPKKYDIWCSGLQEEVLTRGLNSCDVANRPGKRDRSVESYDYRIGRRSVSPEEMAAHMLQPPSNKRSYAESQRGNVKSRIGWSRGGFHQQDRIRGTPRVLEDLEEVDECSDEQLASDLTKKLREEKGELILKIVQVIGQKRSKEIFNITKTIESGGGMLIMNQTRRRTSGGVYLFHVRNECSPEECLLIFEENKREHDMERRRQRAMKRREAHRTMEASTNNVHTEPGGGLEDGELEEGELEMKTEAPLSGEDDGDPRAPVRDPPPSPVTDGRADSSPEPARHQSPTPALPQPALEGGRVLTSYDDDLLDLHVNSDELADMETF